MENSFFELHFCFWGNFPCLLIIVTSERFTFLLFALFPEILSHCKEIYSLRVETFRWKMDLWASFSNFEIKLKVENESEVFRMFSNNNFDCAADNFRSSPILHIFRRLHPTWTRCAALFAFPPVCRLHARIHVQRSNFSSQTLQPPANDIYVKCTFWWHVLFSTTVPWLYSKDDFRIAMVHSWAEKIRSDGCWSNMFPCVSDRIVVDYDEFG